MGRCQWVWTELWVLLNSIISLKCFHQTHMTRKRQSRESRQEGWCRRLDAVGILAGAPVGVYSRNQRKCQPGCGVFTLKLIGLGIIQEAGEVHQKLCLKATLEVDHLLPPVGAQRGSKAKADQERQLRTALPILLFTVHWEFSGPHIPTTNPVKLRSQTNPQSVSCFCWHLVTVTHSADYTPCLSTDR